MPFFTRLLLFFLGLPAIAQSLSWEESARSKNAEIEVVWFTSNPFIAHNEDGELSGVEYELMESFKVFLYEQYQVDLTVNWIKAGDFADIIQTVRESPRPNVFGASAFSITEERKKFIQFTDPYFPDITVLISSEGTPIMRTYSEIQSMMSNMDAVTIEGTNFESMLMGLQRQLNINFDIQYIRSEENILDYISRSPDLFGFTDLPIYLMWIQNGSELTRQNFFTVRGTGYGFIMPKSSDWGEPFNEFLANPYYKPKVAKIISKYIGADLYDFIDDLYLDDQIGSSILTKEKEIQLALIQNANLNLEKEKTLRKFLIIGVSVTVVFLVVIIFLFVNNQRSTKLLLSQKEQIEEQREDIRLKHEQLMNRNAQLIALNEEKNNLMNILAHDLRSPLSNIMGLASLFKDAVQENDGKNPLNHIEKEAERMSHLISKILDTRGLEQNENLVLKEHVDVIGVANEILSRYQPVASKKDISIQFSPSREEILAKTDHMLVFLIMDNLISNAIKFSPRDSEVKMDVWDGDGAVNLKISDQGPGFSEEDKKLMFRQFQKLSAQPTGEESSTGLGLSIVKKYVNDLGGKVWVESEQGQGSTFFVTLSS